MWLDHLTAVASVKLHAIIVRRIVARGDHDVPGLRAVVADRKRKLRRRAIVREEKRIDAEIVQRAGGDFAEGLRKKADVVRDDDAELLPRIELEQVSAQRGDGAADVVVVEHVRAGARKFRPWSCGWGLARLGLGDDLAHGPAAHAAGAKRDVAVKTVVEFRPRLGREEFVDAGTIARRRSRIVVNAREIGLCRG